MMWIRIIESIWFEKGGEMSKVQVLITTMHQKDFSKYIEMNLQTDAVIANQADRKSVEEIQINNSKVKLITTTTRGLSKNRNIAIDNIFDNSQYIMFSDDDLQFHNGYESIIEREFEQNPMADAIKFNLNCISKRQLSMKPITQFKKVGRKEVTSFGVCGLVIKKDVLLSKALKFNERFGSGTENYCGEDTVFYQNFFKKKISLYVSPEYIADIDQSETSWFEGYNENFFTVGGMVINECYPVLSFILVLRSAVKAYKRGKTDLSLLEIAKCYYKGLFKNISERKIKSVE